MMMSKSSAFKWSISAAVLLCLMLGQLTEQLKFSSVQIPSLVQRGTNFWLSCQFELPDDDQRLYSIKWYKNNEEFYRLLQSDNSAPSSISSDSSLSTSYTQQGINNQQQYFAQAGVNVMMSLSNATHVRLLNASLESEGVYACEISTQNLSTIRYEREIRVYVLPNSKLNIIGFKNRYALGDKVELLCSSDYSRPRPALAWFVNGLRIRNSNQWFQLETQSKSKLDEPTLFRLNLGLKFKLSAELLVAFADQPNKHNTTILQRNQRNQSHVKPNTSPATSQLQQQNHGSSSSSSNNSNSNYRAQPSPYLFQQQPPLLLQLKLQCKYKLTEVSDVTFNELLAHQVVSQADSEATATTDFESKSNSKSTETSLKLETVDLDQHRKSISSFLLGSQISRVPNGMRVNKQDDEWLRRFKRAGRWMEEGNGIGNKLEFVTISKSADNQVTQSKCPATLKELSKAVSHFSPLSSDACRQEGVAPLFFDDPLIVEQTTEPITKFANNERSSVPNAGEASISAGESELGAESNETENRNKRESVEYLSRNEARISSRKVSSSSKQNKLGDKDQNKRQKTVPKGENINLLRSDNNVLKVNCSTLGSLLSSGTFSSNIDTGFCIDALDRRRTLISGKYQSHNQAFGFNDDSPISNQRAYSHRLGTNNNSISNKQGGLISYLSLSGLTNTRDTTLDNATKTRQEEQAAADLLAKLNGRDGRNLGGPNRAIFFADSSSNGESSLVSGRENQRWQLLAPPLLEWFINNQEAPKSSASYSPELPLLIPSTGDQSMESSTSDGQQQFEAEAPSFSPQSRPPDGIVGISESYDNQVDRSNTMLPSIDYIEYFANFDSRPIHQTLPINLNLNNKHFMTPDSKLRLRCSSTQALVILSQVASANIIAIPGDDKENQANSHGRAHVGWQQRPSRLHNYHSKGQNSHQARSSLLANNKRANFGTSNSAASRISSCPTRLSCLIVTTLSSSLLLKWYQVFSPINIA